MIESVHTLLTRSILFDMFKNIIKDDRSPGIFPSTGCNKMTHFVWILQENYHYMITSESKL